MRLDLRTWEIEVLAKTSKKIMGKCRFFFRILPIPSRISRESSYKRLGPMCTTCFSYPFVRNRPARIRTTRIFVANAGCVRGGRKGAFQLGGDSNKAANWVHRANWAKASNGRAWANWARLLTGNQGSMVYGHAKLTLPALGLRQP